MKYKHTTDNTAAIEFLKTCHPEWIDEMPVMASARSTGKGNIVQRSHYDGEKRSGVVATYFGAGFTRGDDGWGLLVVSEATEQEFNAAAMVVSSLAAITAGLAPNAGFSLA
jgi:hypothetical protein